MKLEIHIQAVSKLNKGEDIHAASDRITKVTKKLFKSLNLREGGGGTSFTKNPERDVSLWGLVKEQDLPKLEKSIKRVFAGEDQVMLRNGIRIYRPTLWLNTKFGYKKVEF